jgi:hypothetical protein
MHPLAKPIRHVFATCGRAVSLLARLFDFSNERSCRRAVFQAPRRRAFEEHEAIHLSVAGSFTLPSWMLVIAAAPGRPPRSAPLMTYSRQSERT